MASVTFEVKGLRELGERMRALGNEVAAGRTLRQAASAAAVLVRDQARKRAAKAKHKKTGLMENAIQVRHSRKLSRPGREVYAVGVFKVPGGTYANNKTNRRKRRVGKKFEVQGLAYYWRFIEFGSVKQRADPFLVPSFLGQRTAAIDVMKDKTSKGIEKAAKR